MSPAVPRRKDVYPGDIVIKRMKGTPGWGNLDQQYRLGTVMNQASSNSAYVNHNSKSFHVMWEQNSRVELSNIHQVGVVNRQLSRGTKVTGEDGLEGKVLASKTLATVHIMGTTNVVDKVGTERLNPISKFVRGQQIMFKHWVGYIVNLKKNIHFVLDGGMGFYLPCQETDGFMRNDLYWGPGVTCPGMRSRISGRQMRNAVWTAKPLRFITRYFPSLNYLYSMTPCTVIKSEITGLEIDWLQVAPGIDEPESVVKPPQLIGRIDLDDVIIVGEPSSEVLGYNSVRILRVKPEDSITTLDNWTDFFVRRFADDQDISEPSKGPVENFDKLRAMASSERPYEIAVKILNLHTVIDVEWNNGETTTIPATKVASITPYEYQGDYPIGMIVTQLYKSPVDGNRYGVVQESGMSISDDGKGRTGKLTVKWVSNDEEVSESEEVSSFDVRPHESYSMYIRGSVVFPRSYGDLPFKSGYVIDMDVSAAKLVLVCPVSMDKFEVFPHKVVPFSTRVFWNFFQMKYMKDTILPPPYQLEVEFSPTRFFPEEMEPPENILASDNNNPVDGVTPKQFCIWDEPSFDLLAFAPETHRYFNTKESSRGFGKDFSSIIEKEFAALRQPGAIPEGIWVRSYENRMDLVSVLMVGPSHTLYEEGIYLFDLQLSPSFPSEPPRTHFVSYSMEVNPLTSWDGNFCVSSLDWNFRLMETKPASYIANFVAQVQAKIFTKQPFFCDKNKAVDSTSPGALTRARLYNEQTFIRVLDSTWNQIHFPHAPWGDFIKAHFADTLPSKLSKIQSWDLTSAPAEEETDDDKHPSYPLAPVCVGFVEALNTRLEKFKKIVPTGLVPFPRQPARSAKSEMISDHTADSESTPVHEIAESSTAGHVKVLEPVNANLKDPVVLDFADAADKESSHSENPGEVTVIPMSRPGSPDQGNVILRSRPGSPDQGSKIPRSRPGSPDQVSKIPRSRPGSPDQGSAIPRSRPGSPDDGSKIPRSRPGSPDDGSKIPRSRPGSPDEGSRIPRSRPGSPDEGSRIPRSRPGSPDQGKPLLMSRPGSPDQEMAVPRSRPGSPDQEMAVPRSRPGSPVHILHPDSSGETEKEALIPEVFKIPSRKTSSEHVVTEDESVPDEGASSTSGQSGKISAWPVKPQTPEDPSSSPEVLDDITKKHGLMANFRVPLDSLKNVIKKKSKSSSKSSSNSKSKKVKEKSKKNKGKKSLGALAATPDSSVGSGSGGESDMDETDQDLTRRLTAEAQPSSADDDEDYRPSSADDQLLPPEERPPTPAPQNEVSSAPEEIEAD